MKEGGNTALHIAVQNGHVSVCEVLVRSGAKLETRNGSNCTSLMVAARYGRLEILKLLLESGSSVRVVRKSDVCMLASCEDVELKKRMCAVINSYRREAGIMSSLR